MQAVATWVAPYVPCLVVPPSLYRKVLKSSKQKTYGLTSTQVLVEMKKPGGRWASFVLFLL